MPKPSKTERESLIELLVKETPLASIARTIGKPQAETQALINQIKEELIAAHFEDSDPQWQKGKGNAELKYLLHATYAAYAASKRATTAKYYNYDGDNKLTSVTKRITSNPQGDVAWLKLAFEIYRYKSNGNLFDEINMHNK